jgi:hypothetical protein
MPDQVRQNGELQALKKSSIAQTEEHPAANQKHHMGG